MKTIPLFLLVSVIGILPFMLKSQNLEVVGKAKITDMSTDNGVN